MTESRFQELLLTETEHIQKLNQIVIDAVEEEKLISEKLLQFEDMHPDLGSRVADRIASFGGSWRFIASFAAIMVLWISANIFLLSRPFDPYPFILLNLLLSMLAALQAPIIMMSQNRREDRDRQRAVNDYMINLKSEIEIRNVHQKLDLLITEQMKTLFELQTLQLELMRDIKANMGANHKIE
ncbi:MAG TPA: DUF1003 domain-containing protein [Flavipsychrobacter sp.]